MAYIEARLKSIGESLREVSEEIWRFKEIAVFIIGSSIQNPNSVRYRLTKHIYDMGRNRSQFLITPYFPEYIFSELLDGEGSSDLLNLENELGKSVTSVIIILESPGAIAELGAFSNNDITKNKLVVVVDKKHKKEKSFIMLGPIKYLQKNTSSKIVFETLESVDYKQLYSELVKHVTKMHNGFAIDSSMSNIVLLHNFMQLAIFTLVTVHCDALDLLICGASRENEFMSDSKNRHLVSASLKMMYKQNYLSKSNSFYSLTTKGVQDVYRTLHDALDSGGLEKRIDRIRIDALNLERLLKKEYSA